MADHYKKAKEVKPLKFPEPIATHQHSAPIGPVRTQDDIEFQRGYDAANEPDSIFKRVARVVTQGVSNTGQRAANLSNRGFDTPTWMRDQNPGQRSTGSSMPSWLYDGGMPYSNQQQHRDVERITVTRIHADGSREITHRNVPAKRSAPRAAPRQRRPDWIKF